MNIIIYILHAISYITIKFFIPAAIVFVLFTVEAGLF
jgi:hypothetical protein